MSFPIVPLNPKLKSNFTLESTPGSNTDNKSFDISQTNSSKIILEDPITLEEISSDIASNYRSIYYKFKKVLYHNIVEFIDNDEKALLRYINAISLSDTLDINSGYKPYFIQIRLTRGYDGTTPQAQYGYSQSTGSYTTNAYIDNLTYTSPPEINCMLSGSINLIVNNNEGNGDFVIIEFTNVNYNIARLDYVYETDNIKLRFNMGNDPLTLSDMTDINLGNNLVSIKQRILNKFNGKVIKVFDDSMGTYEEMLITGIRSVNAYTVNQLCPNDNGYMPDNIGFFVQRGYNGTTNISNSGSTYTVSISTRNFSSHTNGIINAYIEQNGNEYTEFVSDNLSFNENKEFKNNIKSIIQENLSVSDEGNFITGPVILMAQQMLGFSNYSIPFLTLKTKIIDELLLSENLSVTSAKEIFLILNDLIILKNHSTNKIEYKNLINEVIGFYDRGNVLDYLELFIHCIDFLQISSSATQKNIGQIIEILVNEYFEIFEKQNSVNTFMTFKNRVYDAMYLSDINNSKLTKDFLLTISDKVSFNSFVNKTKIDMKMVIEDIINFYAIVNIAGEIYECYAINLENLALTRYSNYNFNSYCQFGKKYYGMTKTGIADLIYVDPNGNRVEEFQAGVKTGFIDIANIDSNKNNFNNITMNKKQCKIFYMYLSNNGQVFLRVNTNEGDSFDYLVKQEYNENIEMVGNDIGKAVKGTRFQFEVTSLTDFQIQEMICVPLIAQSGKKIG